MWLHTINPSIKLLAILTTIIVLALFLDPVLYLVFWIGLIIITFSLSTISKKTWALLTAPFLFMAIGYVWTAMLFPYEALLENEQVLFEWGWLILTEESLMRSAGLGMRVIVFSALSLLFVLTTKPAVFMLSLMQQLKMPARLAYGIMAGYQFLPLISEEFQIMQRAQQIRGVGRPQTVKERVSQWKSFVIPLLASAIRKAERTAVAMESRGFTGEPRTHWYREIPLRKRDAVFAALLAGLFIVSFTVSSIMK
ncbi:energy-coupling factor transporter transmembrane component T [Jeotgalibacillus sp. ET6]|uniref:energy-coupling factor transporter transmembrane component T family protein n=1 Tax=Jeotgalibacillus sp. ET6 TaxID=3037260 RepID=UPI002418563D|nr:energy-coupling factor transporter transmembrane component T [Jeotgalibacillus sp. ET6]MDG5472785.1 energy-coupling factor transporter transmembrane component T [Jeotgalibacillus sp. ET6]